MRKKNILRNGYAHILKSRNDKKMLEERRRRRRRRRGAGGGQEEEEVKVVEMKEGAKE